MKYAPQSLMFLALASAGLLGATVMPHATAQPPTTVGPIAAVAQDAPGTIVDVASSNESFSTLVTALQRADLADTLASDGPFTVFAPTNAAFNDLPDGVLDALLKPENKDLLQEVLKYHVVAGEVPSSEIRTGKVETLNGGVAVRVEPDRIVVNNGSVVQPDVPASNGVIHVVNRVLVPPTVAQELAIRMQQPVRALW